MKHIFTICLLLSVYYSTLYASIEFINQFNLNYPAQDCDLTDIQMIDVNNDEQSDLVIYYDVDGDLVLKCFTTEGDILFSKNINGNNARNAQGRVIGYNNNLLIISEFAYEYELMIKVNQFDTNALIDSLIIDQAYVDPLFSLNSTVLRTFLLNEEIVILAGFENLIEIIGVVTQILRFSFSDSLVFDQLIENSGESIYDFPQSQHLLTTGCYWGQFEMHSNISRYLNFISKNDYSTITPVNQSSGTSTYGNANHWPSQFEILNANDLHYDEYGYLLQKKIYDTDDGDNVIFMNFLPDDTNTNWTSNETEIGYGLITASTCVYVNNEDHYVMYFRDYQLEIRDRINSNIVYHQESDITPFDIQMDSSNDLLFFVNNEENELISVYKLDDDIYVSAEEPQIPKSIFDMSNYPNPFNPSTTISFNLPIDLEIKLEIYNMKGQKVKQLVNDNLSAGQYSIIWDGKDDYYNPVSSGIYFYKIKTDKYESKYSKMLLLK